LVTVFLGACDRPECHNTDPIFEQNDPHTQVYKAQLVTRLKQVAPDQLRYWVHTWEDRDGEQFFVVYVQGDDLCAQAVLTVPPEKRSTQMRRNSSNAGGSRGAEIEGLQYDIVQDSAHTELIFRGCTNIID
jgi:hypothetical protein